MWSSPAFYSIGGVNWGLQVGAQSQSIIIAIMTERGLTAIMNRRATLGADASIAAGELGKGIAAQSGMGWKSDMYAFAKSEGLFIGIALDGSVIWPRHEWNEQLYGAGATPDGILLGRQFNSPVASRLIGALPR
jgi:lipid-binding SYLF domain-containing protein